MQTHPPILVEFTPALKEDEGVEVLIDINRITSLAGPRPKASTIIVDPNEKKNDKFTTLWVEDNFKSSPIPVLETLQEVCERINGARVSAMESGEYVHRYPQKERPVIEMPKIVVEGNERRKK